MMPSVPSSLSFLITVLTRAPGLSSPSSKSTSCPSTTAPSSSSTSPNLSGLYLRNDDPISRVVV